MTASSPAPASAIESAARQALGAVLDPFTGRDWVSTRQLKQLTVDGGVARVAIALGYPARSQWPAFTALVEQALAAVPGIGRVEVAFATEVIAHQAMRGQALLPGVKNIVAVASGKGGVGKSTTAVNLALALAAEGAAVGLLDADIYGPSQPLMLGLSGKPDSPDGKTITPPVNHGLQMMSIGLLIEGEAPAIWRGPMATQAFDQMLRLSNWGAPGRPLDYLVVDMPPGTGDIHLSISQRAPLTAAVIVTTPQDIALLDARKGLQMFEKVSVPVLGIVENMAVYCCPNCGHEAHIFGQEGGQRLAQACGVPLLGSMPLDLGIREQADSGRPTLVAEPEGKVAGLYREMARKLAAGLSLLPKDYSGKLPGVSVEAKPQG
ncbi:MAG: iron-sulfur cluster carrier protein ApbC [Proteobacteria bacterium]|uniref:iron-sulfur cluster carrier protein ApbC n=1 Tax=Aquabacterium sp. TaxID=1872578 RepID=UPI0035C66D67|nr:iron-sulfur cluster carrier protein ApbC [Pseudomonadota bacterium]